MKRSNSTIYVAFVLLIIGACFVLSWQFLIPKYKTDKEQLMETNSDIDAARGKFDSLKTTQGSLTELGDLVNQMLVAIPEDADAPDLITELEAIGAKNRLVIPAISVLDGETDNSVKISFAVNGDFANLSGLINSLEKDIRFMNINDISLSSGENKAMSLSIQLTAYKRTVSSSSASSSSLPVAPSSETTSPIESTSTP